MLNTIILQGRLTKEHDIKTINGNNGEFKVLSNTIAVNRMKKDDPTDFINFKLVGPRVDTFSKYVLKGNEVIIQGRLRIDNYEKDGEKKSFTYVDVTDFSFVSNNKSETTNESNAIKVDVEIPADSYEDGLPF